MKWLYNLLDDFIGLLFPRTCPGCGTTLVRNENIICTECLFSIPVNNFHTETDNPVARLFWGRCVVEKAASYSEFTRNSRVRSMIHNLKYRGITEVGPEMGRMYGYTLKSSGFTEGIDIVIAVPLHRLKQRKRGYNQSLLIAQGISEATGIPLRQDILFRSMKSNTQTRKSRFERWTNVDGIFAVSGAAAIAGKHILLVDDVITTGSTIEACVNELRKTDGVKVSVVSLAYAVM
ncbi:MAG TPA: ComF family protein [Bacteroidales bacterium]|nr:ComF family protein [Bacteroidales bacterium]